MCGRFVLIADPNVIQTAFNLDSAVDFAPRYNIAPTQYAPVITNETPRSLSMLKWGLIPSWAKEEAVGNKMINARADGVAEQTQHVGPLAPDEIADFAADQDERGGHQCLQRDRRLHAAGGRAEIPNHR